MFKCPGQICEFEAGYGYTGVIWVEEDTCNKCNQKRMCLCMDSSEDEYGCGAICFECIEDARKLYEPPKEE